MIIERTVKLKYGDELREVNLMFKEIPHAEAKEMVIKNHYSHTWGINFGKINVGVFLKEDPDNCLGVASYGNLMNPKSYKRFSDDFSQDSIVELNRLWVDDVLGGNTETVLMKESFRIIKALYPQIKAIQSFADGRLGAGTIYKAMNFRYYGYTETKFYEDTDDGRIYHKLHIEETKYHYKNMVILNAKMLQGRLKVFTVKTYRYIYPLYKKVNIKLEEKPYPPYSKGLTYIDKPKHSETLYCRSYILAEMLGYREEAEILKSHIKAANSTGVLKKQLENKSLDFVAQKTKSEDKLEKIRKYFEVKINEK